MTIRMKDIAKDLGLSVVTVSKVLRDHPDIGEETRKRVLQRVKELDYEPNILARSLVTGRSYLIGLIVPGLIHPFFAEVAKALSKAIVDKGYSLIVSSSEEDPELEAREIRHLLARRWTRSSSPPPAPAQKSSAACGAQSQPFVLIDRAFDGLEADFVGIDDVAAGRIATTHLIEMGRRHIAHISGRENSTGIRRKQGYLEALRAHRLPVREDYILSRDFVDTDSQRQGAEAMRQLLECSSAAGRCLLLQRPHRNRRDERDPRRRTTHPGRCRPRRLRQPELQRVAARSADQHRPAQSPDRPARRRDSARHDRRTRVAGAAKVILEPALVVRASTAGGQTAASAKSSREENSEERAPANSGCRLRIDSKANRRDSALPPQIASRSLSESGAVHSATVSTHR